MIENMLSSNLFNTNFSASIQKNEGTRRRENECTWYRVCFPPSGDPFFVRLMCQLPSWTSLLKMSGAGILRNRDILERKCLLYNECTDCHK